MHTVSWHKKGQVALVQCSGDITLTELAEVYHALYHLAAQANAPIQVIFDGSRMTSCETNASNIASSRMQPANIASLTGFGMSPLNRFMMTAFSNIFKVPTLAVDNMDEAEQAVYRNAMLSA